MKKQINFMKINFPLKAFINAMIIICFAACAKENDALVNPPPIYESVYIRFLNLAGDQNPKTLVLEKSLYFQNQTYQTISEQQKPHFDSVLVQVFSGNKLEYEKAQRQKFSAKSNYIFVALPSNNGAVEHKSVDTVIIMQTLFVKPPDTNQCYIKMLNANPDTGISYSLKLGCPNGSPIFDRIKFAQVGSTQAIYEGKQVVSLIKNISSNNEDDPISIAQQIGSFEVDLQRLEQYVIIINKNDELLFINELTSAPISLQPLPAITERNVFVRAINLSSEQISLAKSSSGEIISNLNSNFIDKYITLSTCNAVGLDKISLIYNGITTDSVFTSFDINKKYSIFAFDKIALNGSLIKASSLVIVPPINNQFIKNPNKATVRIVNGNGENTINVSIGAREATNQYGYASGDILALGLTTGNYSEPKSIDGGNIPIAIFTNSQPTKYLFSSNVYLENGKEYLIAVDFSSEQGRLTVIEQNDELKSISFAQQSAFLQIANVATYSNINSSDIVVNIPNLLSNAKISFASTLATFIPVTQNQATVSINNINYKFDVSKEKRIILVASGSQSNLDIFDIQSQYMGANAQKLMYRFINASSDTPILQVNSDSTNTIVEYVNYKSSSITVDAYFERKYNFIFKNQETAKNLLEFGNFYMSFNKNYTLIFYGTLSNYKLLPLQEY